ncbi:DUF4279 domain-containing protein [Mitsuaria sp. GD03876]|uniref:DUF4279 domain-containing protein n=1 Tax=Mitsuaria sp. GD03876 TaxID=2975399 RepID=UPI00244CF044|nr:DUF4279 domain-containing protein [Mitsuaria sp. GD03876]MDH0863813.1 DUF4279 domain-containing protein [Mitsuaria sp. GD03876]
MWQYRDRQQMISSHIYTVELRFSGENLDPTEISSRLNLQSSNSFSKGEGSSGKRPRKSFWAYNGQDAVGFKSEWFSLEEGLSFLLNILDKKSSEIVELSQQFDAIWWCGHFQNSFDGGPILSSRLLRKLGEFGVPLCIDNYFSDDQ